MSAPFTPGPWHYLDMGEIVPSDCDGYPDSDRRICFMATPGSAINAHERIEANASLIAAAPELYEQVELFVRVIEYQIKVAENKGDDEGARLQGMTLAIAQSVLVKARGQ